MMINQYGLGETIGNIIYLLYTKIVFPHARLIRLPFYLRGDRGNFVYGEGLTLGYGCRFETAGDKALLEIGSNCKFNDRVHIVAHQSVVIGDNVLIASNVFITDTSHGSYGQNGSSPDQAPDDRDLVVSPTTIGNKVWIGEGVCIMPGVTLGSGCVVGANSVVTKSFPANTVVAGVPARAIKHWNSSLRHWEGAEHAI